MNVTQKKDSTRCKVCGFRIKGANHDEGSHHRGKAREFGKPGNRNRFGKKKKR